MIYFFLLSSLRKEHFEAVGIEEKKPYSYLTDEEKRLLESSNRVYRIRLKNVGGLVMPIILHVTFEDGSDREVRLPVEMWRTSSEKCSTQIICDQPIRKIELDPYRETSDVNRSNNYYPAQLEPSRFQLFKARRGQRGGFGGGDNPMQRAKKEEEDKAKADAKPADVKPADAKPAEVKPAEFKPAEVKPADAKPAEMKPAEKKPATPKKKKKKKGIKVDSE